MHGKKYHRKRTLVAYSFILPNFVGYFCMTLIPIIFSFFLSLCEWGSGSNIKFVGLSNFVRVFTGDSDFYQVLWNTFYYTIGVVPITLILALLLAMLMNSKIKGRVFFRYVLFFPYVASLVASAVV